MLGPAVDQKNRRLEKNRRFGQKKNMGWFNANTRCEKPRRPAEHRLGGRAPGGKHRRSGKNLQYTVFPGGPPPQY